MSKTEERDSLGVLEVLIIVGFTSFWAWYFFIIIGYPEFFPVGADVGARRIAQLAAFVGVFIGSVFALHKPKNYEKSAYDTRKTVGWAVVSCVVPALVMLDAAGMQVPYPATVAIMVATGFGAGYYLTGWENLASRGRLSDPLVAFGLVMAIAFALFLVVSLFMTPLAKGVMGIVFALLGAVLFYGVSKRRNEFPASGKRKKGKQPEGDAVQEPGDVELRGTFNRKLDALLLVLNVPLGYGLAVLYLFDAMYFYIAITVALTALVVFVLLMRAFKLTLTFVNLLRIGIGVSVVALIALGMNNSLSLACGILLFATWLVLRLAHAVIVIKLTKVQRVPPVSMI